MASKKTNKRSAKKNGQAKNKLSQVDAALRVLAGAKQPMTCQAIVEAMTAKKLWTSPAGKTPAATLYASILRDLAKGKEARFAKVGRGQFALRS